MITLEEVVSALGNATIDARMKGIPFAAAPFPLDRLAERNWRLGRTPMLLPVLVARESALEHNIRAMQAFCVEHGVEYAPHGKTTMSPQLFERQLRAGAWGITAATIEQLAVYRLFGVPRIIFANQVAGRGNAEALAQALTKDPHFELYVFVDSKGSVEILEYAAREYGLVRPFQALLEIGYGGGRTGVRSVSEAARVADAVRTSRGTVRLEGIAGFEGLLSSDEAGRDNARAFLAAMEDVSNALIDRGDLPTGHIVTAGGSAAFDLVVEQFTAARRAGRRVILRSGCYVTHDHGIYAASTAAARHFRPALELWSVLHSRPEPSLAYLNFGRRDAPFDAGFPTPLYRIDADGARIPVDGWIVESMNDQHARVRIPAEGDAQIGDVVVCGISHPCGAFDRWKLIFVADDHDVVIGGLLTFF